MNKYLIPAILSYLLVFGTTMYSQSAANVGIFVGTSSYLGDINPNRFFYRPSTALGILYRYNLNTRYALTVDANYVRLSGSDLDFPGQMHPDRMVSPVSFHTSLLDMSMQVEFNFRPFASGAGSFDYTPYIATGFSGSLIASASRNTTSFISLPFGLGVKMNLNKRITAGAVWTFRKSLSDRIDGVENPSGVHSVLLNNDWYDMLGVFITYKFFNFAATCPAYQ
jgi:hypothetical protein